LQLPQWTATQSKGTGSLFLRRKVASFCRERQDSTVESRFLALFVASFACHANV
jgi:hypothetical protein